MQAYMNKALIKPNLDEYERLFLSLGDKTRLRLLALMADGPVSVGHLVDELGESQPKVSRHLAYLRNSGVVNTQRDGKWIYYGLQQSDDPDIDKILDFVIRIVSGTSAEPVDVKTSRQHMAQAIGHVHVETITEHDEHVLQFNTEADLDDYVSIEEEVEEVIVESEPDNNELEVFLL